MAKVRNFRTPIIIHTFFKVRGIKISTVFKRAMETAMVVEDEVLCNYQAGKETTVRLTDEEFRKIKEKANEMGLAHTVYMRLLMINYYTLESMEEY